LLSGCQNKEKAQKVKEIIPVKVIKIAFKDISETIDYVGNIKAREEAVIYPKVSGKIIEKIKEDGSLVNKNDIIAYIDRDEVGLKFEKAPVESPLAGIIGRVYVDIGENVTTQTPIALVVDMQRVEIDLDIPEKYYAKISLGQIAKIKVDAYPEEEFKGEVTKISPVVDLSTRSTPIEIVVDNPEKKLCSGMFAKVNLVIAEHKNVPVVLKEAIMGKEPDLYVYLVENGKAILRKITLGIHQGQVYEVESGLKDGDSVVIMGQQKLYEGAQVRAEEEK
ncbi:MAG: efflux RND transporter periplasmic adaptor subunit, partial [Candidatus Omnitrophota bacterium]